MAIKWTGFESSCCRYETWAICRFGDGMNRSAREWSGKIFERVRLKTAHHGLPLIDHIRNLFETVYT